MQHDHSLSIATTVSGMAGGVIRAISEQLAASTISLAGVIDVAFYAVVSASVGYCAKVLLDTYFKPKDGRKP
ncbi:MAG TPA: hypothetical protein DIW47_06300 [Bacteroidetes bacterium]|nr:hypothetical protein [Bacteroidota bacterium]